MLLVAFISIFAFGDVPMEVSQETIISKVTGVLELADPYRRKITLNCNGKYRVFDVPKGTTFRVNGEQIRMEDFEQLSLAVDPQTTITTFIGVIVVTEVDVRTKDGRWR
jgi:hypothetical protein